MKTFGQCERRVLKLDHLPRAFFFLCAGWATVLYAQEAIQTHSHQGINVREGKIMGEMQELGAAAAAAAGTVPKIQIWTDQKVYSPGQEIRVGATANASDATNLFIRIGEKFVNSNRTVGGTDSYTCPCGSDNGGYVSLAEFQYTSLFNKRILGLRVGWFDFTITIFQIQGRQAVLYQAPTHIRVGVLASPPEDDNPIRIDTLVQGFSTLYQSFPSAGPVVFLTGEFPVNKPLFFFSGIAPFAGMFNGGGEPQVVSTDGKTLVVPLGGPSIQGRIILMTQDGSFSTTSTQEFGPIGVSGSSPLVRDGHADASNTSGRQ